MKLNCYMTRTSTHAWATGTGAHARESPPVPAVQALESLHNLLRDMKEATIICHSDNYLYAEFRSSLMGYVDDVEFLIVAGSPGIQIRSASRLGKSDLGANRRRMEKIRRLLDGKSHSP